MLGLVCTVFNFLEYELAFDNENSKFPKMLCVITGKGPLKEFYMAILEKKSWKHVTVITPWLENEDYPKLLGNCLKNL